MGLGQPLIPGPYGHSRILDAIGGSTVYVETPYEDNWVSTDKAFYELFTTDPLTQFAWTNYGALTVFEADSNLKRYDRFNCQNPDLAILSLTGTEDPITGGDEGLADTRATLERIGYTNITMKQYEGMLHAVLFETEKETVYDDVLNFFE